jgi:hypothetical protein
MIKTISDICRGNSFMISFFKGVYFVRPAYMGVGLLFVDTIDYVNARNQDCVLHVYQAIRLVQQDATIQHYVSGCLFFY